MDRNIVILWPTIRPAMAAERANLWVKRSSRRYDSEHIKFIFGVEPAAGKTPLREFRKDFDNVTIFSSKSPYPGVCHMATMMTRHFDFADDDVVILASDDFEPGEVSSNNGRMWDDVVLGALGLDHGRGCLLDDGYQNEVNIVPIPIITGRLLRKLGGVLYHPAYHHFFCDQELYYILQEMDEVINFRGDTMAPLFVHKHHTFGGRKQDQNDINNNVNWANDKATYEAREKLTLSEKLKLPEGFE